MELTSKYRFEKYCNDNFNVIQSQQIVNKSGKKIGKLNSIGNMLTLICNNKHFEEINEVSPHIRYYKDTLLFKTNPFFVQNPNSISIFLYSDVVSIGTNYI